MQGSLLPPHTDTGTHHTHTDRHKHTPHTHARSCVRRRAQASMRQAYTCAHVSPRQTRVCTGPERARPTQTQVYVGGCTRIYTHMKAPHTRVHRYAGEPTPSTLTRTHTGAGWTTHMRVCADTHVSTRSEQRRTDTGERTPSRREPHVQACTGPHTHTGRSAREAISCPLHPDDTLPLAP